MTIHAPNAYSPTRYGAATDVRDEATKRCSPPWRGEAGGERPSRLHQVISARLGRSLPRPVMTRVADVSGGNPFFALELSRAVDGHAPTDAAALPATLSGAIQARIGHFDDDVATCMTNRDIAAALSPKTVEHNLGRVYRNLGIRSRAELGRRIGRS